MPVETLMKAIMAGISNVLETMFFLPVQFAEGTCSLSEWFFDNQLLVGAELSFEGPLSGSLWLLAPVAVTDEITASFLGLGKDEITEEQRADTIKEALNMIGGHGLSLFDGKGSFAVGLPRTINGLELLENTHRDSKGTIIFIETEHNRLAAGIELDEEESCY